MPDELPSILDRCSKKCNICKYYIKELINLDGHSQKGFVAENLFTHFIKRWFTQNTDCRIGEDFKMYQNVEIQSVTDYRYHKWRDPVRLRSKNRRKVARKYKKIDINDYNTSLETDLVIFYKNICYVFEVKSTGGGKPIYYGKAKKQLRVRVQSLKYIYRHLPMKIIPVYVDGDISDPTFPTFNVDIIRT